MKKILAVRMYDFSYFHSLFFDHYINLEFDVILVYCKSDHISKIKVSSKASPVIFIALPSHNTPYTYYEEKFICNFIYQNALNYYENNYNNEEAMILFADDDEYYSIIETNTIISRVVFTEWYLDSKSDERLNAFDFYNLIQEGKCMGQILTLWNDPFYKESVIKISPENIVFFKECVYSNAFHRITHDNKLININKKQIFAQHLKGIPLKLAKKRINNTNDNIIIEDDWCSNHYRNEFKQYFIDYDIFFKKLQSKKELEESITKKLQNFSSEVSFYEENILPLDFLTNSSNIPSNFYKNK